MSELDIEQIVCSHPECEGQLFSIQKVPSAGTYYLMCVNCKIHGRNPVSYMTMELLEKKGGIDLE